MQPESEGFSSESVLDVLKLILDGSELSEVLTIIEQQKVKMVLRAAYESDRASQWIAERTKINAVVLPFTVGGDDASKDIIGFYQDTVNRLLAGLGGKSG